MYTLSLDGAEYKFTAAPDGKDLLGKDLWGARCTQPGFEHISPGECGSFSEARNELRSAIKNEFAKRREMMKLERWNAGMPR